MTTQARRSFLQGAGALAASAALPLSAQTVIPIRVANPAADDDPIGVAAAFFAGRVKELAGNAAAVRVFSRAALEREFQAAGFARVRIANEPYLPFGIHWPEPWSVPMAAYAPK